MRNAPKAERPKNCVAQSVAHAMAVTPGIEAVTIDAASHTISLATLGRAERGVEEQLQETLQRAADESSREGTCRLITGEGDCRDCPDPLPENDQRRIAIRRGAATTTISRVTCPTAPTFWKWRKIPFPRVAPREMEVLSDDHDVDEWRVQLIAAVACGLLGLAGWWASRSGVVPSLPLFVLAYLAGSWFTAHEVWERLQEGVVDVHFLMLAVAVGGASIGAWGEGAMLLFLFSLSGALEHYAMGRTQKEIRALFRNAPKTGIVLEQDGSEREIPVEALRPGMRMLVKPGTQFPVDARVIKGETASDESNLTGEAAPVDKKKEDLVFAGTMNLWGAVETTVLKPAGESSLQKIITLIKQAQQQKAPSQRFTDKFSTYYTYGVLLLSGAMFFVWWLLLGYAPFMDAAGQRSAFYRAMTLLVVASPCALVLSIPSAVLAAIAWGARHGILFRGGAAVEKLASISSVALDKTGTLTTGELKVEIVESYPPGREQEISNTAYSLERLSTHPLARAVVKYGQGHKLATLAVEQFESVTGQGLRGMCDGRRCIVGRREWVLEHAQGIVDSTTLAHSESTEVENSASELWVLSGDVLGRMTLRDEIRAESRGVMAELRKAKLRTVVLTGDRQGAADLLKSVLEVDEVQAGLKPEQKLEIIRARTARGERVAMVGDGVNDAPSLAAAYVGVAMGARGSDAALEQADVILMHDRIENFVSAYRLSQRARKIIRQNLYISLGMVIVLVSFALAGRIPLTLGVLGHEGSTVVVVMNSLRLLLGGRSPKS